MRGIEPQSDQQPMSLRDHIQPDNDSQQQVRSNEVRERVENVNNIQGNLGQLEE